MLRGLSSPLSNIFKPKNVQTTAFRFTPPRYLNRATLSLRTQSNNSRSFKSTLSKKSNMSYDMSSFFTTVERRLMSRTTFRIFNRSLDISLAEVLGHTSFVLVALSYSTSNELALRSIAVTGSTSMLFFTYYHPHGKVLWLPFRWNLLFIGINSYMIGKIMKESYQAKNMDAEDVLIYESFLSDFDRVDFSKLRSIGTLESYEDGAVLFEQGDMNEKISFVVEGEFECRVDGQKTYSLSPGNFIAEAGLHAGSRVTGPVKTSGTVLATTPSKVLSFSRASLVGLMDCNKSLKKSMQSALSWDIVSKLKAQRHRIQGGHVANTRKWTEKRNAQTDDRYKALLSAMTEGGEVKEEDKGVIEKYRGIHVVGDEVHWRVLSELGWTEEDWVKGRRGGGRGGGGLVRKYTSAWTGGK
ncbi:hypothetical protein TrCOL_g12281 [Triparma columacea]|uniref:Cyclic nucleotide-binding domain-containing protein n=1 Tax=Triparma columacea TaxID=722753 RepID=A0A9W7FW22_9STRA|nr:hypothetical protein TrCOL_g12281 [Triparma columacea]